MFRLAAFNILSQTNAISEKLVANVIGINTSKIISVSELNNQAAIKLYTSPSNIGYVTVAESKTEVLSQLGYQSYDKEITFTKTNRQGITLNISDVYFAYPKYDRVNVIYYDGHSMTSVLLISTFEGFVNEFNEINVEDEIAIHTAIPSAHHARYTDAEAVAACGLNGTLYWSCAGASFDPVLPATDIATKYIEGYFSVNADGVFAIKAVSLLNGVTVIGGVVTGGGAATSKAWRLRRIKLSDCTVITMASANIGTEDTSITEAVIDNSLYGYYLVTDALDTGDQLWGARISYTL